MSTGSRIYLIPAGQGIQVNAPSGGQIGFDVLINSSMMALVRHCNQHWRNSDLGILYSGPAHSRRDRPAGVDALAEGTDSFHEAELALSDRPSMGESLFASKLDSEDVTTASSTANK